MPRLRSENERKEEKTGVPFLSSTRNPTFDPRQLLDTPFPTAPYRTRYSAQSHLKRTKRRHKGTQTYTHSSTLVRPHSHIHTRLLSLHILSHPRGNKQSSLQLSWLNPAPPHHPGTHRPALLPPRQSSHPHSQRASLSVKASFVLHRPRQRHLLRIPGVAPTQRTKAGADCNEQVNNLVANTSLDFTSTPHTQLVT